MADLTVPSVDDLLIQMRRTDEFDEADEDYVALILQQSTDLFQIATSLDADPVEPLALRMMQYAILELAYALFIGSSSKKEAYSPFSSERLGSYSYSKVQSAIQLGLPTGIALFDNAVSYFRNLVMANSGSGVIAMASEEVFTPGYTESQTDSLERTLSIEGLDVYGRTGDPHDPA